MSHRIRPIVARIVLALLTALALPAGTPGGQAVPERTVTPRWVPDEALVTFRPGTSDATARAALQADGHAVLRRFRYRREPEAAQNRRYLVRLDPGRKLEEALEAIRRLPGVEAAQPNFLYHALQVPDDPYYYLQWGLRNDGGNPPYAEFGLPGPDPWIGGTDMGFESARSLYSSMTFEPVVVGILDTGIDLAHPDLSFSLWQNPGEIPGNGTDDDGNGYADDVHGWDFAYDDNDPQDGDGHGTHVSGVVGATGDNGIGIAGTAPNARLMVLKFLDDSGSGTTSDAIDAIFYGLDNGAQVLNNSWGGGGYDAVLYNAIQAAEAAGVLFVASAGNDGLDEDVTPHYPSSYDAGNVVSVAASTPWRGLADFSNFGLASVDIAAPGDEIVSTTPVAGDPGVPETAYQIGIPTAYPGLASWSGTSMATPAVSGAAAILYGLGDDLWPGVWPLLSPQDRMTAVRDRLLDRAARWASLSGTSATGGHLDLYNLVEDDTVPPDPAGASLQAVAVGESFVILRWTATGDDGSTGNANYYDLRYQEGNSIDFATAAHADGVWTPAAPGSLEYFTLTGLAPGSDHTIGLEVVDNAGNRSARSEITVATLPLSVLFTDDMESGQNGWTTDGSWALTTDSWNSPAHSWTDSPAGLYASNQNTSLTSPAIPSTGEPLGLSFWQRYDVEPGFDFCYVEARAHDGVSWGSWTGVSTFTGTEPSWHGVSVALPVTGGQVQVRFRLQSDAAVQADGWYVDDVTVFRSTAGTPDVLRFQDTFGGDDCSLWSLAGEWGCEAQTLSDSPGGDYPLNYHASAVLGSPVSLAGVDAASVSFDLVSFDYELGYDFLFFQYSLDGVSWRTLGRYSGPAAGTQSFALDELAGAPAVHFRFVSLTDYGVSRPGAQIDNFEVRVHELPGCTGDPECDDGLFCNGPEVCNAGTCEPGTPPAIDDGVACTVDSCDEGTDTIVHAPDDAACDDGDACTANACDPLLGCTADPVPPPSEVPSLTLDGDLLSWTPIAGAAVYDVVSGDLEGLAAAGLTAVTTGCVADDWPQPSVFLQVFPPPGSGAWFLVRAAACGSGSYGAGEPPQAPARDDAIALSGLDCVP